MKKIFIFLILLLNTTFAQKYDITGVIGDKETGKPLSFANIRIDKTTDGTTSNYDGQFILKLSAGNYKLIFSYVGYKTDTILVSVPTSNQINIYLQPEAVKLSEIVVSASEDPAYRIIREAIARKKQNRKGLINLEYNAYSKRILKSAGEVALIEETFVKGYNEIGKWEKEFILSRHKTENQKKQVRSMDFNISDSYYIDFSKDTLTLIMDKVYLPIADNAFDYYDYKLLDITESPEGDIYRIKVIPRSDIQPLLRGEITIEGNTYSINSINLETNEGVRFLFVKNLSVKFVQQLGKYNGYWLPNYVKTEAGFTFSFQGLLSLEEIRFEDISSITGYKINAPVPDSVKIAVNSKYGGFTSDTTGKKYKPYELTREEINEQRPIPLTKTEIKAYAELDSSKTLEKMIKVSGPLSGLISEGDSQNDTTTGVFSAGLEVLNNYITFGNNRVAGVLIGPRYNGFIIKDKLLLDLSGGYAFNRKKAEGELKLNYLLKKFFINDIELQVFNESARWEMFTPYSSLMNGIAVTTGFDDQFNYYLSSGFGLRISKNLGDNSSVKVGFISEKESSLKEKTYQSIFKTHRLPRENPEIVEGMDRRTYLKISLGKDPMEIQFIPENGLTAQFDFSNPAFNSDFNYKKFRATGLVKFKTIYRELFIAPYLEIILDAGTITGSYGPQHLFSPNTALGFFAPPGVLKGLNPYRYAGTEMVALYLEHNWRTIPFQALGLDFISDLYLDFITGINIVKTWNKSDYLPNAAMDKPYWEIYAGLSKILGVIKVDVNYNSLKNISVTATIGVVL
ncbi:DUF5686 and carboxypeptidase regulatory-like domain-containing protein [bacterium BMS3Abin03]|nr:DUF5686 and carboxypeptidase regulatory-like domain-containing protein [bacterium BMS3Abin03]